MPCIKRQTKYRTATTTYPCFLPDLGEFNRSWSHWFAVTKVATLRKTFQEDVGATFVLYSSGRYFLRLWHQ